MELTDEKDGNTDEINCESTMEQASSRCNTKGFRALFVKYKQLISFAIVGCLNTGVDFLVFTLLHKLIGISAVASHGISYFAGVINSYLLNRTWTFRVKKPMNYREFIRFVIVNGVSWGASVLVVYVFEKHIPVNIYIGKIAASLCALVINFLGSKLFVFRTD